MESIILKAYDTNWQKKFEKEKDLLEEVLRDVLVNIRHIGSTAIEDLLSKPIIDISLEALDFPPSEQTIEKLSSLNYTNNGESGVKGRYWFTKGQPREFNLHYCNIGSEIVKQQLLFGDKLRATESLRRAYEAIKVNNKEGRDTDSFEYALAKKSFIKLSQRMSK